MKCNKSLISALLFCALALTLPAGNADLLTNGSFENGLDGWRVNNVGGADATAEPDQQASDGKQSLKIRFGKERRKNVYITVWRSLKVQPWSSYRLSFKAKTRNSKPFWAGMEYRPAIYVKDGNSDWKEYSFEFKSEQRTSVHFRFLVDNTAEGIWLDDVKLEKIPNVSPEAGMEQSILAFGAKPDGKTDCSSAFKPVSHSSFFRRETMRSHRKSFCPTVSVSADAEKIPGSLLYRRPGNLFSREEAIPDSPILRLTPDSKRRTDFIFCGRKTSLSNVCLFPTPKHSELISIISITP